MKMIFNLKTRFPYNNDYKDYFEKMEKWFEGFEEELRSHMKRNFDTISMGEKLLTLDILGYADYEQGFKDILRGD